MSMDKICRICLGEGVFSSIFTKSFSTSLCDMIQYCCKVKVIPNDGLPEQVCSNCVYKLGVAYHFKQTCEGADVRLRQYLGLQPPQKYTDANVMTDPMPVPQTIIKKCKCKLSQKKTTTRCRRKPEEEKLKRGPKPKPKQIHACYECNKEFRCQAQLESHIRTHTGEKPFSCMYCPRSFAQKPNLSIHLRIHTGEKPYQCEVCSKSFSAQGNLQTHLKMHKGVKDHVCSLCSKAFVTSSELSRHISTKHRGVKNFKCDICGHAFSQGRDLRLHKLRKHQIDTQEAKPQEAFNNSNNIDIIGIDVGKEIPIPPPLPKETHSIHLPPISAKETHNMHLTNQENESGPKDMNMHVVKQLKHPGLQHEDYPYQKGFQQYVGKLSSFANGVGAGSPHACTICGEVFDYISSLGHHYLQRHKECDATIATAT